MRRHFFIWDKEKKFNNLPKGRRNLLILSFQILIRYFRLKVFYNWTIPARQSTTGLDFILGKPFAVFYEIRKEKLQLYILPCGIHDWIYLEALRACLWNGFSKFIFVRRYFRRYCFEQAMNGSEIACICTGWPFPF